MSAGSFVAVERVPETRALFVAGSVATGAGAPDASLWIHAGSPLS